MKYCIKLPRIRIKQLKNFYRLVLIATCAEDDNNTIENNACFVENPTDNSKWLESEIDLLVNRVESVSIKFIFFSIRSSLFSCPNETNPIRVNIIIANVFFIWCRTAKV